MVTSDRVTLAATEALMRSAEELGLRVADLGDRACLYQDRTINTGRWIHPHYVAPSDASDLAHEIAHFLVAHPVERDRRNFGWPHGPTGVGATENINRVREPSPYLKDFPRANGEEAIASVLGILAERALGLDWRATWHDHLWHWKDFWPCARALHRVGLVSRDLVPRFLVPL